MSSFVDGVPARQTFIARYNLLHYDGSVAADQPLPVAGVETLGADATIWAHGLSLLWWLFDSASLGERWGYARAPRCRSCGRRCPPT